VLNLLTSALLSKFLYNIWQQYFGVYVRNKKKSTPDGDIFLKLPYIFKLFEKIFKLNVNHGQYNTHKLIYKFSLSSLVFLKIFKLILLKNFQYLYSFYFNYLNIYLNFSSIFGAILSFYDHFLLKKRKINFRRKIRKNILIENKYI
jgi:hypothetical protein